MKEIILATNNSGKIKELQALLAPVHCISQSQLNISSVEETGLSFVENALIKARHVSAMTHKPALADDSGLVVAALKGEPGIYSARYAGQQATDKDNLLYLLEKMQDIPEQQRQAYFYCAIVVVRSPQDPIPLIAWGKLAGTIAVNARGGHGFGYDPIFYLPSYQCTLAELPAEIKNALSHRSQALKQLRPLLQEFYE